MKKTIMVLCVLASVILSGCSLYEDGEYRISHADTLQVGDRLIINPSISNNDPYFDFGNALVYEVLEINGGYVLYKFTRNHANKHIWSKGHGSIPSFLSSKVLIHNIK